MFLFTCVFVAINDSSPKHAKHAFYHRQFVSFHVSCGRLASKIFCVFHDWLEWLGQSHRWLGIDYDYYQSVPSWYGTLNAWR